jgi:hypothetical protein
VGRTGTNHLATILSKIPEIDPRRELFNPVQIWECFPAELAEFSGGWERLPCSPEHPLMRRAVERRPAPAVDCLADMLAPEKQILVFKVFAGQLSVRQVKKAIIARPDTVIIFIRRRPIDTYISHRKASKLKKWLKVDTTEFKVAIEARRFLRWWRQSNAWYRGLEAACWDKDKPFYEMTYEDDIAPSPAQAARRFCAILEDCGVGPFTMPGDDPGIGLNRQDRNTRVDDRIANWPQLERDLIARGSLDKAFEPFPHYQPTKWDRLRRRCWQGYRHSGRPRRRGRALLSLLREAVDEVVFGALVVAGMKLHLTAHAGILPVPPVTARVESPTSRNSPRR